AAVLPAGMPKAQYDYALSLMLKQQDFAKAETALKSFIETNPNNRLTGNAHYWLGETFYVRESYQDAAFAFAEGFQKYPKGNKAPDSLLKLGMSLDRLEKRREACTAYSRLLSTFPKAGARLKARVQREQSRAKCR
ncbi:MAG: tol-pal system protein YbgF, partial [Alphaproteobacteria bacterium]|nr:tol-pal system protein YbgF [Alphaproteobacteria bacterium]